MPTELLLDTGAFVALVDRSEKRHADCVAVFEHWTGPILTTEAVLTETLYLIGPAWRPQKSCLEFLLRGAFLLAPSSRTSLQRVTDLVEKYHDLPMDYADATLVALAEDTETDHVFTLDHKGFSTYRLHGKKPFRLAPYTDCRIRGVGDELLSDGKRWQALGTNHPVRTAHER